MPNPSITASVLRFNGNNLTPRRGGWRRFVVYPFLLAAATLLNALPCAAQERGQAERPPIPVPATVEVLRGGEVRISLRAAGKPAQRIDFLIRTPPQHGRLTPDIRATGPGVVTFLYSHDGKGRTDAFEFAVQSPGSSVSKPAEVRIRIFDPPPRMALSTTLLDFGELPLGEGASAYFTIRNTGGGVLRGRLRPPPEVALLQSADYALGAGEEFMWEAKYRAQRIGRYRAEISVGAPGEDGKPGIGVVALVRPVFEVSEQSVELDLPRREGTVRILNSGTEPVEIAVEVEGPFEVEGKKLIAPQEETELAVHVVPDQRGAAEGAVIFKSGLQEVRLAASAPALPPEIALVNAAEFDGFLKLPIDTISRVVLRLENVGGTLANARVSVTTNDDAEDGSEWTVQPAELAVRPGQIREVTLQTRPVWAGRQHATVVVEWDGGTRRIPLRVEAVRRIAESRARRSGAPERSDAVGRPAAVPQPAPGQNDGGSGVTVGEVKRLVQLTKTFSGAESGPPGPERLHTVVATPSRVLLAWTPAPQPVEDYRVELRRITTGNDGSIQSEWRPIANIAIAPREDGVYTAEIRGVPPERLLVLRVRGMLSGGGETRPSNAVRVFTGRDANAGLVLIAGAAAAACAVAAGVWWLLVRRSRQDRFFDCNESERRQT